MMFISTVFSLLPLTREAANTNVIVFSLDPTMVRTHDILKISILLITNFLVGDREKKTYS
jgi:hypothetical protein